MSRQPSLYKNGDNEAREGAGVARLRALPNCVEGSNFKAKKGVPELP